MKKKMSEAHSDYGLIKAIAHNPVLLPILVPCAMAFLFFPYLMDTCNVFLVILVGYNLFAVVYRDVPVFVIVLTFFGGLGANITILIVCKEAELWAFGMISAGLCGPFFVLLHLTTLIQSDRERQINIEFASRFLIKEDVVANYRKKHGGVFPKTAIKRAMQKFEEDHPDFQEDEDLRRQWKDHARGLLNRIGADDMV